MKLNQVLTNSITPKFIIPVFFIGVILSGGGVYLMYKSAQNTMESQVSQVQLALQQEKEFATKSLKDALSAKVDALGRLLAKTSVELILAWDYTGLAIYEEIAKQDPDIVDAKYVKPDGQPYVGNGSESSDKVGGNDKKLTQAKGLGNEINGVKNSYPIIANNENLGEIVLIVSEKTVNDGKIKSQHRIDAVIDGAIKKEKEGLLKLAKTGAINGLVVIAALILTIYLVFRIVIKRPLDETYHKVVELSSGEADLTARLAEKSRDEFGLLASGVNRFIAKLDGMIKVLGSSIINSQQAISSLKDVSEKNLIVVNEQSEGTHSIATAITEMSASIQEVSRNASLSSKSAHFANDKAKQGQDEVDSTVQHIIQVAKSVENSESVIVELQNSVSNVSTVLEVIQSIAEQTNLLALNAAIEAARAGEQGRGFAVVADEVRVLAGRTKEATEEISGTLKDLQNGAKHAVESMADNKDVAHKAVEQAKKAGLALNEITQVITEISEMSAQIATAIEEQSATTEEMSVSIESIKKN